jgi:uncharacterized protein
VTIRKLDGEKFALMVLQGATHLSNNAKMVDALNVFPVPDGDTGTNMNLTISSGAKEVESNQSAKIGAVAQAFARGLLMGARGNSGVILSQLFRGFSKSMEGKETITATEFATAFEAGVTTAYKAVMKPVEGTILTVAKDAANHGVKVAKKQNDIVQVMAEILKEAKASLQRTPDLLPVLKEVGVVDSGGQGLVTIYEGFLSVLEGKALPKVSPTGPSMSELVNAEHHIHAQAHMKTEDIHYGYCTEFMVRLDETKVSAKPFSEEVFRNELSQHGDSLLVVADESLVKVHIHTEKPGDMLSLAQDYGELIKIKIENMREQHSTIVDQREPDPAPVKVEKRKEYGIVTVAMGDGIKSLFESIGATTVIQGGQTMNPSTEDIVKAIKEANGEKIVILPNNSNIVMAAEQAASVVEEEVVVIKTKTIPQGISAILAFNPTVSLAENEKAMTNAIEHVKSGQITFAVRDTTIDGVEIKQDDFMGLFNGKIVISKPSKDETIRELLQKMLDEDDEILTLITGEDAEEATTDELIGWLEEEYPDLEVEIHDGGQPIYSYIISVE